MYTAFVLSEESRQKLAVKFPPRYTEFIGHHVTVEYGVPADYRLPDPPKTIKVIGRVDNGEGLEVLVVSVNGKTRRPDGRRYHITWSLERSKFKPRDSNTLLDNVYKHTVCLPIPIEVTPALLR